MGFKKSGESKILGKPVAVKEGTSGKKDKRDLKKTEKKVK